MYSACLHAELVITKYKQNLAEYGKYNIYNKITTIKFPALPKFKSIATGYSSWLVGKMELPVFYLFKEDESFMRYQSEIKKNGSSENELLEQCNESDSADIAKYVNQNIIGGNTSFSTPFGRRRIVYCDHIASGKSLEFIEDFIRYA